MRKNFRTDLHEIFKECWQWASEQTIKFLVAIWIMDPDTDPHPGLDGRDARGPSWLYCIVSPSQTHLHWQHKRRLQYRLCCFWEWEQTSAIWNSGRGRVREGANVQRANVLHSSECERPSQTGGKRRSVERKLCLSVLHLKRLRKSEAKRLSLCTISREQERYSATELRSRLELSDLRVLPLTVAAFARHLKAHLFSCPKQRIWGLFIFHRTTVHFLPPPTRTCNRRCLFVCLSVC